MRGLFGTLAAGAAVERKSSDAFDALTWSSLLGAPSSKAGVAVNIDTALRTSTVLACARVLAEGVAQVPLKVLREADDGSKAPAKDLPAYKMLYRRPNPWMTSFEFRETMMFHAVLTGDGIAIKNRDLTGAVRELLPVPPGNVTITRGRDWETTYTVNDAQGAIGTFTAKDVLHLKGPSWSGVVGLDIVRLARDAIGLAIATEETHARLHANGVRPSGVISVDGPLSKEGRGRIQDALEEVKAVHNTGKTLVLDQSAKWLALTQSGVDAQHIATRQLQIEEVCRFLRVFPQMVGYADKTATFASAEAFFLAHVIHSLMPWIERWEEVIARDILDEIRDPRAAEGELIARFFLQGLLRGDSKTRAEFYTSGIQTGWLTRNEARRYEDLNPLPGGDELLTPLNMVPAGQNGGLAKSVAEIIARYSGQLPAGLEDKIGRVLSTVGG